MVFDRSALKRGQRCEPLWDHDQHRLLPLLCNNDRYLLEERDYETFEAAAAAAEQDDRWREHLALCRHLNLLVPIDSFALDRRVYTVYPCPEGGVHAWRPYVAEVFSDYMADEALSLELSYRLSLSWGALIGLRPVPLTKPTADLVLLTGDGQAWCLPPRLGNEEAVPAVLSGIGEILFEALTRQVPEGHQIGRARDLNREITIDASSLVARTQGEFTAPGELRREAARIYLKRHRDRGPIRDSGPLGAFRAIVPTRDRRPEMRAIALGSLTVESELPKPPRWLENLNRIPLSRVLVLVSLGACLALLLPFLQPDVRGYTRRFDTSFYLYPLFLALFWGCVATVLSYRKRIAL